MIVEQEGTGPTTGCGNLALQIRPRLPECACAKIGASASRSMGSGIGTFEPPGLQPIISSPDVRVSDLLVNSGQRVFDDIFPRPAALQKAVRKYPWMHLQNMHLVVQW